MNNCVLSNYGDVVAVGITHKWTIINFSDCCQSAGEYIVSPVFKFNNDGEFKWQIRLYPYGLRENDESGYISLYLSSMNEFSVNLKCTFSVTKNKNDKQLQSELEREFEPSDNWGFPEFVERDQLLEHFINVNGTLTITCDISNLNTTHKRPNSVKDELLKNFNQLFNNKDFCDVTITANGKKFQAHKAILTTRSTVFEAMLKHNMIEKEKNLVEIKDMEAEIIEEMLRFIYTGEVKNLEINAANLAMAADRYALQGLKSICSDELCQYINMDTVVDLLVFANCYNIDKLKKQCNLYIAVNAKNIIDVPGFKLLENEPQILIELFRELAIKQD